MSTVTFVGLGLFKGKSLWIFEGTPNGVWREGGGDTHKYKIDFQGSKRSSGRWLSDGHRNF